MAQHSDEVDRLLRVVMPEAPEVLHHVFALEGANEVLLGLNTVESKAAYLVQIIAVELYKASKAICPKNISLGPNDLRFHILRSSVLFASYPYSTTMLELGGLEDLYYAACAKLQELIQGVNILLTNGFKGVRDTYFAYHNEPLHSLGPITVGTFKHTLLIHERILHSSELRGILNKGVIEKNSRDIRHERYHEMSPGRKTTQLDTQLRDREKNGRYINMRNGEFEAMPQSRGTVAGLQDKCNMSCGMIFGELAEKYRPIAMSAELKGSLIDRTSTPEAPQAFREECWTQEYISPYNLNERAKKLNVAGGPEMPCICDPECICAPLCASEPTQNCLCEENGLFVRVTEGMNIDDLDVPDLVRRRRQSSEASQSSAASLSSLDRPSSQWALHSATYVDVVTPLTDQSQITSQVEKQIREQNTKASDSPLLPGQTYDITGPLDDVLSTRDILDLSEEGDGIFWQDRLSVLPLRMSDFTQYELTQPFSKQCDHPPKRQSVTERLFRVRTSGKNAHRKYPAVDEAKNGHNVNGATSKIVKQPNKTVKRSLADISFTGLRLNRYRDSHDP